MEVGERIVLGAKELFFRYGVKSITMDDIARHLAVSKKTIYQFFSDKNALVCAVAEMHMKSEEEEMIMIRHSSKDPVEEVLKVSEHLKVSLLNMNMSLLFEIEKYHHQAWMLFSNFKNDCINRYLVENMEKGKALGLYRKEINVEILARLRTEEIIMGFNTLIFSPQRFQLHQIQVEFLDHFLYGICTLKGHKLINRYKQIQEED